MKWIVMPFIDNLEMTEQALMDCLNQTLPDVRVLLIDQGSRPEHHAVTFQWQVDDRVFLWRHNPPLPSLAATWNQALRFLWSCGVAHGLVVNNDVRLAPWTYELLLEVQQRTQAWFVTGQGVTEDRYRLYLQQCDKDPGFHRHAIGHPAPGREDGPRPEGYNYGGPDFSCFLISYACQRAFQFDDQFIPAYHEDNDFHRRLQLAGFGDRIFGLNLPFLHYGSATINRPEMPKDSWQKKFAACQDYYIRKWGGLPGHETFRVPFNYGAQRDGELGFDDPRVFLFGQGRGEIPEDHAVLLYREYCHGEKAQ